MHRLIRICLPFYQDVFEQIDGSVTFENNAILKGLTSHFLWNKGGFTYAVNVYKVIPGNLVCYQTLLGLNFTGSNKGHCLVFQEATQFGEPCEERNLPKYMGTAGEIKLEKICRSCFPRLCIAI